MAEVSFDTLTHVNI